MGLEIIFLARLEALLDNSGLKRTRDHIRDAMSKI